MVLDEVSVDGDDLSDFLVDLEQSFGITFPQNLTHVRTAGDLFEEIVSLRAPNDAGDRCDTAMAFFLLRRSLAACGLQERARPSSTLRDQNLGSPRKLRTRVTRETGLELPPLVLTGWGSALVAILAMAGVLLLAFAHWAFAVGVLCGIGIAIRFDRGSWSGNWETLGSLSRATAARNVMKLSARGARSRRQDWWRTFVALFVESACLATDRRYVTADEIGPATRFRFT